VFLGPQSFGGNILIDTYEKIKSRPSNILIDTYEKIKSRPSNISRQWAGHNFIDEGSL